MRLAFSLLSPETLSCLCFTAHQEVRPNPSCYLQTVHCPDSRLHRELILLTLFSFCHIHTHSLSLAPALSPANEKRICKTVSLGKWLSIRPRLGEFMNDNQAFKKVCYLGSIKACVRPLVGNKSPVRRLSGLFEG